MTDEYGVKIKQVFFYSMMSINTRTPRDPRLVIPLDFVWETKNDNDLPGAERELERITNWTSLAKWRRRRRERHLDIFASEEQEKTNRWLIRTWWCERYHITSLHASDIAILTLSLRAVQCIGSVSRFHGSVTPTVKWTAFYEITSFQ